jgi:hypothetical protein
MSNIENCNTSAEIKCLFKDISNLITGGVWKLLITDDTFHSLFKFAMEEYMYHIDKWSINNNWSSFYGKDINSLDVCMALTTQTLDGTLDLSKWFSEEVGLSTTGTNRILERDKVDLVQGQQSYKIPANREVKHVYFGTNSTIDHAKFAAMFTNTLYGNAFGGGFGFAGTNFGNGGVNSTYLLMPSFDVISRSMNMNLNDRILNGELTYRITLGSNNERILHFFSIPNKHTFKQGGCSVYYDYYDTSGLSKDEQLSCKQECAKIYSPSRIDLPTIEFCSLNNWSKTFVRKWLSSLVMETEARVRGRFDGQIISMGGKDITMNFDMLISQSKEEMATVKDEIKEFLLDIRSDTQMERKANEVENMRRIQSGVPIGIFVI